MTLRLFAELRLCRVSSTRMIITPRLFAEYRGYDGHGRESLWSCVKRINVNIEYYYTLSKNTREKYVDPFSIGIDINTGGHIFQLYATNAQGIIEQHFIGRTTGKWLDGDIHIGFNISRSFTLKKSIDYWE